MGKLDGKVAIITGGASGIGEATVKLFVEEGAKVVIADIDEEKGNNLAQSLEGSAVFQKTDVLEEEEIKALVQRAVSEFGRLDIMHNNAGAFGARGSILDVEAKDFDFTFSLLIRSAFLGIKHAGIVMKEQGSGIILNTCSISSFTAGYGPHVYQAAKAALNMLTRTAALELAEYGIRINCISPGGVHTPLIGGAFDLDEDGTQNVAKGIAKTLPLNRVGTPLDMAKGALFLCCDDSSYITSHNLVIDGAESTGQKWTKQGMH